MTIKMRSLFLLLSLAALLPAAQARIVEEQMDVPVQVTNAYGRPFSQFIKVTLFREDERKGPQPLLVLSHGRAVEATDRLALGRVRYSDASRWFVQQGFVVALPTRMGYGVSGGEDVEDSGGCENKNYPPGYEAAAQQVLSVVTAIKARAMPPVDRWVAVGQSYGGAVSVTLAAKAPEGLAGTINFAGGGGGNPKTRPGNPCGVSRLERMFESYGRTARMPTLWIYTENDLYMGAKAPRDWVAAFSKEGGQAKFVQFPPHGEDGHSLFARFPQVWQPVAAEFLQGLGFAPPAAKSQDNKKE